MDVSKLVRKPELLWGDWVRPPNSHQLITKAGCEIMVPANYTNYQLAVLGADISVVGIFAVLYDRKHYAVSKATGMLTLGPCEVDTIQVDGEDYLSFTFAPGSVVIKNTGVVKNKKFTNDVMSYFIDYARVPWFFNQVDHAELFKHARHFNGMAMGKHQAIMDLVSARLSRNPNNVKEPFRLTKVAGDKATMRPRFIPLRDLANNATSNLARITGPELQRGIRAALLAEPDHVEPFESLFLE